MYEDLISKAKKLRQQTFDAFVVHGEEKSALAFAETLRDELPKAEVNVPEYGDIADVWKIRYQQKIAPHRYFTQSAHQNGNKNPKLAK